MDRLPQKLSPPLQMQAGRGFEGGRRGHQARAQDHGLPQIQLQPERGQGLPEGSQHLLDLRHCIAIRRIPPSFLRNGMRRAAHR